MQNIKKRLSKLFRGKGYYIALALCVAAVGVSGYLFTRSLSEQNVESERLDALLQQPAASSAPQSTVPDKPASFTKPGLPAAVSDLPTEPPETAVPSEPPATAPATPEPLQTVFPVEGTLLQTYSMDHLSYNETTRDWRTHDGMDFAAAAGTPVVAAADGVVESVFVDDFLGKTVTVRHEGGYVTHYANLAEEVPVAAGDAVKAGDTIGAVGATALLEIGSAPHLHFAVFKNNVSVDPERFLTGG